MAYVLKMPVVTIVDEGGCLALFVDWNFGAGPEFSASYPTGSGAAYQEAGDRERARAERLANAHRAEILALYPNGAYAPE